MVYSRTTQYYSRFFRADKKFNQVSTAFLVLVMTIKAGADSADIWYMGVNQRPPQEAVSLTSDITVVPAMGLLAISAAQLVFAHRMWCIAGKRYWLSVPPMIISASNWLYSAVILGLSRAGKIPRLGGGEASGLILLESYLEVYFWVALAVDAYITACMSYLLIEKRTGWKTTDTVLNLLLTYTLGNAAIVMLLQLGAVICIRVGAGNAAWGVSAVAFEELIPESATLCILHFLLARKHSRSGEGMTTSRGSAAFTDSRTFAPEMSYGYKSNEFQQPSNRSSVVPSAMATPTKELEIHLNGEPMVSV